MHLLTFECRLWRVYIEILWATPVERPNVPTEMTKDNNLC